LQIRSNASPNWICVTLVALLCATATAQSENVGSKPIQVPGRHTLKGTLTGAATSKSFSEHFGPGLYRLTYLSKTTPAVLEIKAQGRLIGRSAPTRSFTTVLSAQTGKPIDLLPTGLCSSDVAIDGDCALEKIHFRVALAQTISIEVDGIAQSPGDFTILVDSLQEAPPAPTLSADRIITSYLAFDGEEGANSLQAEFAVKLGKGQRFGILLGSPDFTTALEVRDSNGKLVANSTDFNELLDPCREVKIDHLPKFDPLSQADSYVSFQGNESGTYTVRVSPQYRGETGLYVLRGFDLTDPTIGVGQMRTGYVGGAQTQEFNVNLPPGWQPAGNEIIVYSPLPVSLQLTDETGKTFGEFVEGRIADFESGLRAHQLYMLHWGSINLDKIEVARLSRAKIEVKGIENVPDQFFLVGLGTRWGSCGGGAVDPISVLYPALKDFQDQGYPLIAPKMSTVQLEATVYSTARNSLRWYFLLESPDGEDKDPETLVSSYAQYVPDHVPLSEWLVEFQLAIRVQFSAKSETGRLWTRVERRGYKEKQWQFDAAETAKAQQVFATQIEQAFREWAK
jgi:hypothetical protein